MAVIIQFSVGDLGAPQNGSSVYFNPALSGKQIKVFREGAYQYSTGPNFIVNNGLGAIIFSPEMWEGERIRIQGT